MLYFFENFVLDPARRELRRGKALIAVQPQVFDLLEYLITHRDRVVSKDDILGAVWGGRMSQNRRLPPASTRRARQLTTMATSRG
jgi:DNA-binding winged helix-turn-helix (wHTH) protein